MSATLLRRIGRWSLGAQSQSVIRTGQNKYDYRLGNEYTASAWTSFRSAPWLSVSIRRQGEHIESIINEDERLQKTMTPLNNSTNSGAKRIHLLGGFNMYFSKVLSGIYVSSEYGIPVVEIVDRIQMKQSNQLDFIIRFDI